MVWAQRSTMRGHAPLTLPKWGGRGSLEDELCPDGIKEWTQQEASRVAERLRFAFRAYGLFIIGVELEE